MNVEINNPDAYCVVTYTAQVGWEEEHVGSRRSAWACARQITDRPVYVSHGDKIVWSNDVTEADAERRYAAQFDAAVFGIC